ncbi:MAG: hypothetical protein NNA22_12160, partial [Nitrospira sp.]|nr:hypothetical protein [Nitrospira sp.]
MGSSFVGLLNDVRLSHSIRRCVRGKRGTRTILKPLMLLIGSLLSLSSIGHAAFEIPEGERITNIIVIG